jgi:hypothetical protein
MSKEESLSIADLKNLIIAKIENLIFGIAEQIYLKKGFAAMESLQICFTLLPPDIRSKMESEEQRLDKIIQYCSNVEGNSFFQTQLLRNRTAKRFLPEIRGMLGKTQKLLYDYYLRAGYRGLDLNKEAKTLDLKEKEE